MLSSTKPVRLYDPSLAEIDDGWVLPDETVLAATPAEVTAAPSKSQAAAGAATSDDGWGLAPEHAPATGDAAPAKLDLNAASFDDLRRIPGIGPLRARRIVSWRAQNGRFADVSDLRFVRGIGAKTLVQLSEHLTVS